MGKIQSKNRQNAQNAAEITIKKSKKEILAQFFCSRATKVESQTTRKRLTFSIKVNDARVTIVYTKNESNFRLCGVADTGPIQREMEEWTNLVGG